MFYGMKVASLLGKLHHHDAAAMDSWQVLNTATSMGAQAIGPDHHIGSIEPWQTRRQHRRLRRHFAHDAVFSRRAPVEPAP